MKKLDDTIPKSSLDEILEAYHIGQNIFEKLFEMTDKEVKYKLTSICGAIVNQKNNYLLSNSGKIQQTFYLGRLNET